MGVEVGTGLDLLIPLFFSFYPFLKSHGLGFRNFSLKAG